MGKLFRKWLSLMLVLAMVLCSAVLAEGADEAPVEVGEAVESLSDAEGLTETGDILDDAEANEIEIQCDAVDEAVSEADAVELAADAAALDDVDEAQAETATEAMDAEGEDLPLMAASLAVAVNATNFPDANFRQYVTDNFDVSPQDGYLTDSEIAAATKIDLDGYWLRHNGNRPDLVVRNLKGIEFFPYLETLLCDWCYITSLDISGNTALTRLNCDFTSLSALDISRNTALTKLECSVCGITALDVSQNRQLRELVCYGNEIASLDISSLDIILPYVNDQYKTVDDHGGLHGGYKICTYRNHSAYWQSDYIELCCPQTTTLITVRAAAQTTKPAAVETPSVTSISVPRNTRATVNVGALCQIDLGGKVGKKYRSSKKKVATVDANGLITARSAGKTKITFKVGRKRRTLTLTVVDPTIPKSVSLNMSGTITVKQGDSITLSAILPTGTSSSIKWKSSRRSVATVKNGVVTFKKKGSVTITATTVRGKKKARVKFKVQKYDAKKDLANYGWRTVQGTTGDRKLVFRKTHTGGYMSNHKFAEGEQIYVNLTWREGGDAIAYDNGTYGYVQYKYIAW